MANNIVSAVSDTFAKEGHGKTPGGSQAVQMPDILVSTAACMGVTVASAVLGFFLFPPSIILYVGLLVGILIFGVVLARKSPISATAALSYSAALGVLVGAFTNSATTMGGALGLISQALLGTVAGTAAVLIVYSTKFGQTAAKATKFFTIAVLGYALVAVFSFGTALLGLTGPWGFYGQGVLGLLLCVIGVTLAAWSLLVNIDFSKNLVDASASYEWRWSLGMGISSSIVWMYIEILRLLSIVNSE